jgi:hypothetical protein
LKQLSSEENEMAACSRRASRIGEAFSLTVRKLQSLQVATATWENTRVSSIDFDDVDHRTNDPYADRNN